MIVLGRTFTKEETQIR